MTAQTEPTDAECEWPSDEEEDLAVRSNFVCSILTLPVAIQPACFNFKLLHLLLQAR